MPATTKGIGLLCKRQSHDHALKGLKEVASEDLDDHMYFTKEINVMTLS
jgi:hypothetical protein